MNRIFRIIFAKINLLVRMAIIVSLVGYSFSTVDAAMHGDSLTYAALEQSMADMDHSTVEMADYDHHQRPQSPDDASKTDKQNCCENFCSNAALVNLCATFGAARMTSLRFVHFDEQLAKGELAPIHNPPSA